MSAKNNVKARLAKIFDQETTIGNRVNDFPKFLLEELKVGKMLGKGGFGTVWEVREFEVGGVEETDHGDEHEDDEEYEDLIHTGNGADARKFIAEHCLRKNKDARYAIKRLSPEVLKGEEGLCVMGMADMALETRFLSDILHPNIVKLIAVANCNAWNEDYFIVMDRLYETLETRILKWKKQDGWQKSIFGKLLCGSPGPDGMSPEDTLWEQRIVYAYDLCAALSYLHKRQIIYRDMKPENVGFDVRDDIKLFDFGLSRELREEYRLDSDESLYKLTGDTGSPRYMPPEVALGKAYNATCDSYSFSILVWQMLALKQPFEMYTIKMLKERVYGKEQKRPFVPESWSLSVRRLLESGWSAEIHERLTMEDMEKSLRKECVKARGGDDSGLEHKRRRSTHIYTKGGKKGPLL